MLQLKVYDFSDEDSGSGNENAGPSNVEDMTLHLKEVDSNKSIAKSFQICAAPSVLPTVRLTPFLSPH